MFDLWGVTAPLPMPSLDLEEATVSTREKLAWEKELMGVYLSEHPFSAFASKVAQENTTLCGQVDAELAGQTVRVAGMVASVNHLFTRDRRPFASATLEDLDGQVEVMVWSKVYENTRELWQEGNSLLVEGKVRLRDDRVQLNCDSVVLYQPETTKSEEAVDSAPDEAPPAVAEEAVTETTPVENHRLVISMIQTSDENSDLTRLNELIDTLRSYSGKDEVILRVSTEEKVDSLKLSSTSYCPELHKRIIELVGEEGLQVESRAS
jgi:DNA polymerase-3 subunit alpha